MYYIFIKNDSSGLPVTFNDREGLTKWILEGKYPTEAIIVIKGERVNVKVNKQIEYIEYDDSN